MVTNSTILITGGGSGIGRGLAEAFHAQGNKVIITGRRMQVLEDVVKANPGMTAHVLDIADADAIRAFAAKIVVEFPKLNMLINNAGIMCRENLLASEIDLTDAEASIAANLVGPIRLTSALLPHLRAQPQAMILMVSSGLAFVPRADSPTYGATKAAIHSYTQSLRYQLKDTSVRVVELIPPYLRTELTGARQASDPMAMPLGDFIAETMALLTNSPDAEEICVDRAKPQRFAEANGGYAAFFRQFNDRLAAALSRAA
jgi:uncharacterized oxidoreductase